MKKLSFKHTAHWLIFTLANLLILFAACSKDSDNNDTKPNTVTLNREEKKITRAAYGHYGKDNYRLFLYLNNSNKERVVLGLNKDSHIKGNAIELSQPETAHEEWYWGVIYCDSNDNEIIKASGHPDAHHFTQGTLTVSGTPGSGSVNILLKNGIVMGLDDKTEYTLTLNYSGAMEKKQ